MNNSTPSPRIGVSSCLLGNLVRFDSGHKRNRYLCNTLESSVTYVPVCPEVELGMTVPRESMRLTATTAGIRLTGNRSQSDYTERMQRWARKRAHSLASLNLDGFVLKKDSPSCGFKRVKIYQEGVHAAPSKKGTGLFAQALEERLPWLPVTEEGWLCDRGLRNSFLERVFTHRRIQTELLARPTRQRLIQFHTAHKLLVLARSPAIYRELGRLVGTAAERPIHDTVEQYISKTMQALGQRDTVGKHSNVLQHIVGHFKAQLSAMEKRELLTVIQEFRTGLHDLDVPLTLLLHHLRKHQPAGWLREQHYFQPYPRQLSRR